MKWLKHIFISTGILVLVCFGGYITYNVAYATGEAAGHDRGYDDGYSIGQKAGYEEGYSLGKADGYDEGYSSGKADGYDEGYSSGKTDGYNEGYTSGRADGYEAGYSSGKTDGYQTGYDEGTEAGLGHGYTLKDPTYEEVITFLRQDRIDENEYVKDTYGVYVCSHFARDVCNNAEKAGLRCAFVELRYPETGHTIIAFDTIDMGLVYFEPITDERAKPVVGKRYYQCIVSEPDYYYEKPSFDDTIMDILVIW